MMDLEARLLAAHAAQDLAALAHLYGAAGAATSDPGARAFFLTQAYVYALDAGSDQAADLRAALVDLGAEPPLP